MNQVEKFCGNRSEKIPSLGESITEAEVGEWLKQEGQLVGKDEKLVLIESEKATVELIAPVLGRLSKIPKPRAKPRSRRSDWHPEERKTPETSSPKAPAEAAPAPPLSQRKR
jgi:2-oxoglutarate dehydrogenase E2 component (dihydrolipoamide succinyltransferase)